MWDSAKDRIKPWNQRKDVRAAMMVGLESLCGRGSRLVRALPSRSNEGTGLSSYASFPSILAHVRGH